MRRQLGQIGEVPDTSQSHLGWSLEKRFANGCKNGVRVWYGSKEDKLSKWLHPKICEKSGVFSCLQDSFAACPWRRPRSPATAGRAALTKGLGRELGTVGEAEIN